MGPMRAVLRFLDTLKVDHQLQQVATLQLGLYGSLAATGKGHGTDRALCLGMMGFTPDTLDVQKVDKLLAKIHERKRVTLLGEHEIQFDPAQQIEFHTNEQLPFHPNGMCFVATDANAGELLRRRFYSVGGGFIVDEIESNSAIQPLSPEGPLQYSSASELLSLCEEHALSISDLILKNECASRSKDRVESGLDRIAEVMQKCIDAGCET